jgi:hypothetical protein
MAGCVVQPAGELLRHRPMTAAPDPCLQAVAPSRAGLVAAVEGLFTWDWRADLWAAAGLPFVRAHALSRPARHKGTAKTAQSAAHQNAALLPGGMRPPPLALPPTGGPPVTGAGVVPTCGANAQHSWPMCPPQGSLSLPEIGKQSADPAHREGGAARFAAAAGPKPSKGARALLTYDAARRTALAL